MAETGRIEYAPDYQSDRLRQLLGYVPSHEYQGNVDTDPRGEAMELLADVLAERDRYKAALDALVVYTPWGQWCYRSQEGPMGMTVEQQELVRAASLEGER